MSVQSQIDSYIDYIMDTANVQQNNVVRFVNAATGEANSTVTIPVISGEYLKNLVFVGDNNLLNNYNTISDLRNEFDSKYHYLLGVLSQKVPNEFNGFINTYFPKPSNFDNLEKFLVDSVFNGSIGLPPEVEKQIWDRANERVNIAAFKNIMESRKSLSARGMIEVSGVETYREMIIMNEATKELAENNRNIAIECAKLRVDWVKFAISEARNYRQVAMENAFKYLSYILSLNDSSFKYASGYVDSYKTFYDTLNSYFNSVNNINRLNLEKASTIDRLGVDAAKILVDQYQMVNKIQVDTAIENARVVASLASAGMSSLNSISTQTIQATAS